MSDPQPLPDMNVEPTFDAFVEWFGGELVRAALPSNTNVPLNADYFFRSRSVIAELKCLETDYTHKAEIGRKVEALIHEWAKRGRLRPEHFAANRININALGDDCAMEVFKLYFQPIHSAVKQANRQIRKTKEYFNLPNAKGLVIIANDGNYAMTPEMSVSIFSRLLKNHYSSIDSFIYFTPNMRFASHRYDRQANLWMSGASNRISAKPVEDHYLIQIKEGWIQYIEYTTGQSVTVFNEADPDAIRGLHFVRPTSK
jgi:hypothetical protein